MRFEMRNDCVAIERFHAQAEVIQVATFNPRRRAAHAAEFAVDADQVYQRCARTQLQQANFVLTTLDTAAQDVAIERLHRNGVVDPQDDVIELLELIRRSGHGNANKRDYTW